MKNILDERRWLGANVVGPQGQRQIYGSQIGQDPKINEMYVLPLDDPDGVDDRRA